MSPYMVRADVLKVTALDDPPRVAVRLKVRLADGQERKVEVTVDAQGAGAALITPRVLA